MTAILEIDPNFCNFSGQVYDNGVNITVQVKGIHVPSLGINSREFVTLCGRHKLSLVFRYVTKCGSKAISFFGTVQ
jgi:hypothetical protein